jgi:hypothetical protein
MWEYEMKEGGTDWAETGVYNLKMHRRRRSYKKKYAPCAACKKTLKILSEASETADLRASLICKQELNCLEVPAMSLCDCWNKPYM